MIQFPVLSHAAASPPGPPVSAEILEATGIEAEFRALLGLQLNGGVVAEPSVDGVPAISNANVLPQIGKPGGKSLPDETPFAVDAITLDEDAVHSAALAPGAPLAVPADISAPMPDSPAQRRAMIPPRPAVPVPEEGGETNPRQPAQVQGGQTAAAIVHPLPSLPVAAVDETAAAVPAERAPIALTPPESGAALTPAAPQITFAVPGAPGQSSAVSVPGPVRSSGPHDFAALVDRLVEARDTALAVQVPRAVIASVAHADFGDIAIRFEHRGDALSASLLNPDPELARAVQTAPTAAQSHGVNDGGTPSPRQDAQGQAAGNSSSHSSQAQSQQRGRDTPARNFAPQADGRDDRQPRHGGVFA